MARSRTVKRVLATRRRQKSASALAGELELARDPSDENRGGKDGARSRKPASAIGGAKAKRVEAERASSAKSSTSDALRREARREIDAAPMRPNAEPKVEAPRRARASALEAGDDNTEAGVPAALSREVRARSAGERKPNGTRPLRRDAAG